MILVVGATGTVGSEVVAALRARGAPVRALVRDAARARAALGEGVDLAEADLGDAAAVRRAFDGVLRVFLLTPNGPQQLEHERAVLDAAAAARVERVVKLSAISADPGSAASFLASQGRAEALLARSGLPATVLRPNFYMSNVLAAAETVRAEGRIYGAFGDGRLAMIHPRDLGESAAAALTGPGHAGRTIVLSGPEAVSFSQVAERLTAVLERPVAYVDVPPEAMRGALAGAGLPDWLATGIVEIQLQGRAGIGERTTEEVERLTGHPPRGLDEYLRENAAAFA
jgi:uncharacterized protein YbjT (DUF2867 family)